MLNTIRDVQPIFARSCAACHTESGGKEPAGNLNLDADDELINARPTGKFPGTYFRLALDEQAKFGHKPVIHNGSWRQTNASRYIRQFQSRRSLLCGKSTASGWTAGPTTISPPPACRATPTRWSKPASRFQNTHANRDRSDLDYRGKQMPPPEAVKAGKVQPLTDEDRRTLVRWIDLGCPIDLDFDPQDPDRRGYGWMGDDKRPTLTLTEPRPGTSKKLDRISIGMSDYYSGLDEPSLEVIADFPVDDTAAGENLAARFRPTSTGVWELKLAKPIGMLESGRLEVRVKDKQGNQTEIVRTFAVE